MVLSLGSPLRPPPRDVPGVIDQTRGILRYVDANCPGPAELRSAGGRFVDGAILAAELRALLRSQGVDGLGAGLNARIAKRALSTAITWTLFEEGERRLARGRG